MDILLRSGGAPGRFAVAISGCFAALRLCQIGPGSTPLRAFGPPLRAPGADPAQAPLAKQPEIAAKRPGALPSAG